MKLAVKEDDFITLFAENAAMRMVQANHLSQRRENPSRARSKIAVGESSAGRISQ